MKYYRWLDIWLENYVKPTSKIKNIRYISKMSRKDWNSDFCLLYAKNQGSFILLYMFDKNCNWEYNIYKIYEVVVGKSKFKAKQFKKFNYSSTEVSANEQVYLAQIEKVYPVFVCAFLMLDWNHRFSLRKTIWHYSFRI